jgi:hypothetical protein
MKKGSVSYGILIHGILPHPLLKIDPPVWKIEPPWYFDPLISNQEIGRGVKIPWIGGSIYHWEGGQNTMDRGVNIPWVGGLNYHG